jgi:ppGpp synthetase/RelA/SpoT-type nucleotidyltranferase
MEIRARKGEKTVMNDIESRTLMEVRRFLDDQRRNRYETFLIELLNELTRFRDRRFRSIIYRIYDRGDKQLGGRRLKEEREIARKLIKLRQKTASTRPTDVYDIIAVTIVVYFHSQIDLVHKALTEPNGLRNSFTAFDTIRHDTGDGRGYYAIHVKVKSENPVYRGILGEIQIKTLLNDGWGAKTHDLIYKSRSYIGPEMANYNALLGEGVQLLERQSEVVKQLIEKEWQEDQQRKRLAQSRALLTMTQSPRPDYEVKVAELARTIGEHANELKDCDEQSELLRSYLDKCENLKAKYGANPAVCRLITYIVSLRESGDLNSLALDAIDELIDSAEDGQKKIDGMTLRALAYFTFGNLESSVSSGRSALQYASEQKLKNPGEQKQKMARLKMNLAYFLAEDFHSRRGMESSDVPRDEALKLVRDAWVDVEPEFMARFLDTKGAVEIVCGKDAEEIKAGIEDCRKAFSSVKNPAEKATAQAYLKLHERRAFLRLLELDASEQGTTLPTSV